MLLSFLKKILNFQFIKFLLVGGLNTAFGYLSFAFFNFIIGNAYVAVPVSTVAGILFNFKTYGNFVFKSKDHSKAYKFFAVYLSLIGFQLISLKWLFDLGITNSYLAVGIMVLPMSTISFVLMKRFVFTTPPLIEVTRKEEFANKS
jgi:putative flippase GtrA